MNEIGLLCCNVNLDFNLDNGWTIQIWNRWEKSFHLRFSWQTKVQTLRPTFLLFLDTIVLCSNLKINLYNWTAADLYSEWEEPLKSPARRQKEEPSSLAAELKHLNKNESKTAEEQFWGTL